MTTEERVKLAREYGKILCERNDFYFQAGFSVGESFEQARKDIVIPDECVEEMDELLGPWKIWAEQRAREIKVEKRLKRALKGGAVLATLLVILYWLEEKLEKRLPS